MQESEIVFVTTSLYTKWLNYQQEILKGFFPRSQRIVVDGRKNWPISWFYWIDKVKKTNKRYYIHIDEDCFITSRTELLKAVEALESKNIDLLGCSDGYHRFRPANPVAINPFLMIGRVSDLRKLDLDLKNLKYKMIGACSWENNLKVHYKESYKNDFNYKFEIEGLSNFEQEYEPYYSFMWSMKELGCKFGYLYPFFDERFTSTNPRLDANSKDIAIHMWYTRQHDSEMNVFGVPNIERYNVIEKYIHSDIRPRIDLHIKNNRPNLFQTVGYKLFIILFQPFYTKKQKIKLKTNPFGFFIDSRSLFTRSIGKLLRII